MINQKKAIFTILFIISTGVFYFLFQENKQSDELTIHHSKDILLEKFNQKSIKKNSKDYVKSDKPDKFLQLMSSLKVRKDKEQYLKGYKLKETLKAQEYFKSNNRITQTISNEDWIERGPNNVPGRTRTLVVDKNDPTHNTWIAGSVSGGIWKTINKGQSWTPLTDNFPTLSVSHISQSESNPNILYACTGEGYGNLDGVKGDGIFKSTDGGNTWFSLENTLANEDFQIVNRLIIDPNNPDNLTVCTSANIYSSYRSSIFVSKDGGMTWRKTYEDRANSFFYATHQIIASPDDFNIQYAAVKNRGILKSTDMGETWYLLSGYRVNDRIELAISSVNSDYVYASIAGNGDASDDGNLYVSKDAGDTWILLEGTDEVRYLGGQGWYDNTIMAHPFDENSVYVGGVDLWKVNILNEENDAEFQRVSNAYDLEGKNPYIVMMGDSITEGLHPDHHYLVPVVTDQDEFFIINTSDGGVFYSNTGTNPGENDGDWTFAGHGYNTTQFYGIDKKTGENQYIGGSQDNGTWISLENPSKESAYTMFLGGDGFDAIWHSENSDKLMGTIYNNLIFRSENGGRTYVYSSNGITDFDEDAPFITKLANSKQNPETVFTVGAKGVWKTTNFGQSWSLTRINSNNWQVSSFIDIKISEANTDVVWAGNYFTRNSIWLSKDDGESFTSVSGTVQNNLNIDGYISGITADPLNEETAYLLFAYPNSPKIIKTTDFGENWVDISGFNRNDSSSTGFPNVAVYDLLVFPFNDDYLWAGTEIGIFESLNGGESWHPLAGNIPNVCIWDMKYSDNQVYIGTHGRGVWSIDIPLNPQPKIKSVNSTLAGIDINIQIDAEADSIVLYSKENVRLLGYNTSFSAGDHSLSVENTELLGEKIRLISYKNNRVYKSELATIEGFEFSDAQTSYFNNFEDFTTTSDFSSEGITFNTSVSGFTFAGLHSEHPYLNNTISYSYLKTPIIVKEDNPNFFYKDVAFVSDDGDYVSIEAKKGDGEWVNISGNYNSSFNTDWKRYTDQGANGAEVFEVRHQINLQDFFSAGDTISIRFKLSADEDIPAWGWAITYLNIQSIEEEPVAIDINEQLFSSSKVYPTLISDQKTTLEIETTKSEVINCRLFNLNGQLEQSSTIRTTVGNNKIVFPIETNGKGVYILVLDNNQQKQSFKIVLQ